MRLKLSENDDRLETIKNIVLPSPYLYILIERNYLVWLITAYEQLKADRDELIKEIWRKKE